MMLNGGEVGMAKFDNRERLRLATLVDIASRRYEEAPTAGNKAAWLAAEDAYNDWLQQFKRVPHKSWVSICRYSDGRIYVSAHATEIGALSSIVNKRSEGAEAAIKLIEWEDGEGL